MLDLNKIINIIKETKREVILAHEEPVVVMSMNRYRELISSKKKNQQVPISTDNFRQIKDKDYLNQVKSKIMPETGIDN